MFYGLFGLCELGMSLFLFEISEQFTINSYFNLNYGLINCKALVKICSKVWIFLMSCLLNNF